VPISPEDALAAIALYQRENPDDPDVVRFRETMDELRAVLAVDSPVEHEAGGPVIDVIEQAGRSDRHDSADGDQHDD
jgi:hypothetical protein